MRPDERARGSGSRTSGVPAAVVAAVLGSTLLAGCASVRSAQETVGGWFGDSDEQPATPIPEHEPTPRKQAAKKPAPKAAVSAAPEAGAPEVDPASPVDAEPAAEPEAPVPPADPQAPERSIFDPY